MKRFLFPLVALVIAGPAFGQATGPTAKEVKDLADKGYAFFKGRQKADGSFEPARGGPGTTALIAASLIRHGYGPEDPVVSKALAYMEKNVQPDGGIYNKFLANYTTCIALITFKEANKDGKYDKVIADAAKFLKTLQQGGPEDAQAFGGVGYDAASRPDVSNTHFFVEALVAAGLPKDDPAIKNALVFLGRCQNLPGESNKMAFAKKATAADKGGFVYNPFDADNAKSNKKTPEGGLRSEGGMTYSGLKSFLYAGVDKKDPRVAAALKWIGEHYTVDENPGMKDSGLFYYYHTFAKAMAANGEDVFTDAKGKKHPWKAELFATLKKQQKADGSWANSNGAFLENAPELATSFALLAISYTTPATTK
ncbi:prenyltransferase/squalene oxidase repeat-containing protein [Zavarzinella formosa]|uniref:prenyltransferase/squalene oxidase repeat-containing protein n=1 Tax=Zavarzinella formosa TaxID=360055 RepID=UPI00031BF2F8|nr:prenyltransferase/squalene oxidase repeat-containing protein [Zavarzinella formosa]